MPAGPLLAWKRGDALGAAQRLVFAGILAILAVVSLYFTAGGNLVAAVASFIAIFAIAGAITEFAERIALFRERPWQSFARAIGLPRAAYGSVFAHAGIGIALLGVVAEASWSQERIVALKPGEQVSIGSFDLRFAGLTQRGGPNWRDDVGRFEVRRGGALVAVTEPAKRIYLARGQPTTEAGITTFGLGQLYVSLGDPAPGGGVSARIYWKPLVLLIWLGPVLMAIGGVLSLSDRRLRIGAPRRAKRIAAAPA
jgi:cytochrome c-type biogenesis protein CcmF